jgi:ribosomal protein S2
VKQSIKRLKEMKRCSGRQPRAHHEEGSARLDARARQAAALAQASRPRRPCLFVIDVGYQKGAVAEANKLGVPGSRGRHQP